MTSSPDVFGGWWAFGGGDELRVGCRIAGVEPTVEYVEFAREAELLARLWSENGPRRHMSKGAKAMVYACMFPEPKGGMHSRCSCARA